MKRFVGLLAASAALVVPTSIAGAAPAPSPAGYRAECEQAYQGGKSLFDPLITNAPALMGPAEQGFCGEQKHTPKA
ncbi:MAG TPA: hypothetical protein VI854_09425 [Acidimicrobiia bacterium]|nr:hypothetical protein [Acidimicrobiia bacterium]